MPLEQIAFDIETTGFNVNAEVTAIGFAMEMGVRVMVQTDGRSVPHLEETVSAATDTLVNISKHTSERDLFTAVGTFAEQRLHNAGVLLVAYNGERWNGGFDLPFLRTRLSILDIPWPFVEVPYADVMPLVHDRFNTTVAGDEFGELAAVYDVLCDGDYGTMDPFEDSDEAVAAYVEGRLAELALHNVADVLRTRCLGQVSERYCSKSEFQVKALTPTRAI